VRTGPLLLRCVDLALLAGELEAGGTRCSVEVYRKNGVHRLRAAIGGGQAELPQDFVNRVLWNYWAARDVRSMLAAFLDAAQRFSDTPEGDRIAAAAPEGPVLATFAYRHPGGSPDPVFVTRLEDLDRYGVSIPYAELEALTGEDGPGEIHAVLERHEDRLQMRLNGTSPESRDLPPVHSRWSRRPPGVYLARQSARRPATQWTPTSSADREPTRLGQRQVYARYICPARSRVSRVAAQTMPRCLRLRSAPPGHSRLPGGLRQPVGRRHIAQLRWAPPERRYNLPASGRLAGRKGAAITSAWQQVLTWRDMIRMNNQVPVPAEAISGLATTPLPRPAEVIEKPGLWKHVPPAEQNGTPW
jgi:hypothetical protein